MIELHQITLELLQSYYNVPLADVANEFGVSLTMLKKVCRKFGIQRWPHRQIRSINKSMQDMVERLNAATTMDEAQAARMQLELLDRKRRLVAKGASSGLQSKLRNALFLANPNSICEDDVMEALKRAKKPAGGNRGAMLKTMQTAQAAPIPPPQTTLPPIPELPPPAREAYRQLEPPLPHPRAVPNHAYPMDDTPQFHYMPTSLDMARAESYTANITLPKDFSFDQGCDLTAPTLEEFLGGAAASGPLPPQELPQYMHTGLAWGIGDLSMNSPADMMTPASTGYEFPAPSYPYHEDMYNYMPYGCAPLQLPGLRRQGMYVTLEGM